MIPGFVQKGRVGASLKHTLRIISLASISVLWLVWFYMPCSEKLAAIIGLLYSYVFLGSVLVMAPSPSSLEHFISRLLN